MLLLLLPFSSPTSAAADQPGKDFLQCLDKASSISHLVYTQTNPSYSSVLQFSIRNPRFNTTSTTKPLVVVTPRSISHIQATIKCSQKHGLQLRVRSGGHDYEGISYTSVDPNSQFIVMDMINLREITVDVESKTAWVQAGATLGELYYAISQKSRTLAFPGGICPTVGIGGYVSGGGYGNLLRKYGLAADNVVDAVFVDAKGRTLDRHSMGEDMFWAIRGGGGNSFGVAVAWKATFNSMYLGGIDDAVKLIQERFPELGFGWEGVWKKLNELGPMAGALVMIPYGGKMGEIPEWSLPFPHRAGNLFMIQYDVFWNEDGIEASERNVNWIREVYSYMTPFVSKNPREGGKGTSYKEARVWGLKYFKNNFDRLVKVKTAVDPDNFFRNEQSIPPL
ncbi:Berberine bridge enzyme-like 27 [Linum perenne]